MRAQRVYIVGARKAEVREVDVPDPAPDQVQVRCLANVGHTPDSMGRAMRLLERRVLDQSKLITHRHPVAQIQQAMELATERPKGYIKGVLLFES